MSLVADVLDFVTGSRPAVRNRVKFFLLTPSVYDGFYRLLPASPHAEIARHIPADARRIIDLCTGTALVPAVLAPLRPQALVCGVDLSPEMLVAPPRGERAARLGRAIGTGSSADGVSGDALTKR